MSSKTRGRTRFLIQLKVGTEQRITQLKLCHYQMTNSASINQLKLYFGVRSRG